MRRLLVTGLCVLVAYLFILGPFTQGMAQKPYAVRLGIIPNPSVLQILFPDFQELLGANILSRVILYYGSLKNDEDDPAKVRLSADYPAMSRAVHAALRLDPYNMDGYYFGQAILVWDVGQYRLATDLLEYGMQYRTWDWQLPFFAGFDYAYFLKDNEQAAKMYMRAGALSGETLFQSLAGRYLQEAGDTQMAIDYLTTLEKSARTQAVKKTLQVRIDTFKAILVIEAARDKYLKKVGHHPLNINALVEAGYLATLPVDPYGGEFYLDKDNQVRTTSKLSFAIPRRSETGGSPTLPSAK
jgi:tetratricopeptide (TPR) repeat protein